jgi:Holliday junction resolvase RusA-like endonuclease
MYVPACPWRKHVALRLKALDMPYFPKGVAVKVTLVFRLSRPKSHYGIGRNAGTVKASAPQWPLQGHTGAQKRGKVGDVDNYVKAVLDEMNGVCFDDDSQVVMLVASKLYAPSRWAGVTIQMREMC